VFPELRMNVWIVQYEAERTHRVYSMKDAGFQNREFGMYSDINEKP
jgi:hypothetical protein